jgi:glycosyltransferase involved in cell wall biosynthesis
MNPAVRVHLLTYRRPKLLPRALDSLLRQSFRDWICEIHNDAPDDNGPNELACRLNNPRIKVVTHSTNWGLVRSFNEIFRKPDCRFLTVLEDDNWWDDEFLETMVRLLNQHPEVSAGWANMRLWEEQPDGKWVTDRRCIWNEQEHSPVELLTRPSLRSSVAAAHSQGAMLWRSAEADRAIVPDWVTPSSMEAIRERSMRWPLLFHSRPLGNYAVTLRSVRDRDAWKYGRDQSILLASFCTALRDDPKTVRCVLDMLRGHSPYSGHAALIASLAYQCARPLLQHTRWRDWWYTLRSLVRRPVATMQLLRPTAEMRELADELTQRTRECLKGTTEDGPPLSLDWLVLSADHPASGPRPATSRMARNNPHE